MAEIRNAEAMVLELMGKPTQVTPKTFRYGGKGSLAVRRQDGVFYSFETGEGGDPITLVMDHLGCDFKSAKNWLVSGGYWANDGQVNRSYLKHEQREMYQSFCFVYESWSRQGKAISDLDHKKYEYQKAELAKDCR